MTPNPTIDQMRIEVSKWLGWKEIHWYEDNHGPGFWSGIPSLTEEEVFKLPESKVNDLRKHGTQIPALTLDWLHECEKKMNDVQKRKYAMNLHELADAGAAFGRGMNYWVCIHATAEQRLTALYRTIKTP